MDLRGDILMSCLGEVDSGQEPATPLQARTLACQAENAALFRGLRDTADQIVENLEAGGSVADLGLLFVRFSELEQQAGDGIERLGALLSSCGTA